MAVAQGDEEQPELVALLGGQAREQGVLGFALGLG
jgi:hypothetical protein